MTIDEIAIVVRHVRLAQGLRQDQLAAAAGVGLRFLVELERGKPTVRLDIGACRPERAWLSSGDHVAARTGWT